MSDQTITITGRSAVLVNKHTSFELSDPSKTAVSEFCYCREGVIEEDGKLCRSWAKDGWRHVGWAEIKVEVMPVKSMLKSAVKALKVEKEAILADAHKRATDIESEIQKLLAIEFDGSAA
jgi:hypothetical protein